MPVPGIAGAGAGGYLGTLYVVLTANATKMIAGMKAAETAVTGNSAKMLAGAKALSKGVAGAMAAIGVTSVIAFAKFDKAMTNSLAIMGDVSNGMRKEMELTARQLALETTTSATTAAEAYFFLASAGLSAEQSIAALSTVNTFAIAGNFDMATATDLLTDAQSALGLTVKDTTQNMENMNRVSDVLVKANTLANATVEQFSESLTREAGAALKSFNIDVEEGVAVLAAFADQGVKGQIAGTSLSRILRLMTSAAVKNASAYKEMGVAVFDANGNIRNMADIIQDLEVALGDLSDEQRTMALEALGFQARVQGVILPLLGTSEAIRTYEKELRNAGGTTDEVANKQMKSFSAQMKILWNNLMDVFITIGEQIAPVLAALNKVLMSTTGGATGLGNVFKWFVNQIGPVLVTVIGVIGDAFWGWKIVFQTIKIAMLEMVDFVLKHLEKMTQQTVMKMNSMIAGFNAISPLDIPQIMGVDSAGIGRLRAGLIAVKAEAIQNFDKMMAAGSFSSRLKAEWEKIVNPVEEVNDKIQEKVAETTEKVVSDMEKVSAALAIEDINKMYSQVFDETGQSTLTMPQSGDAGTFQMEQFREQRQAAEEQLAALQEIADSEVELTEEANERKMALMEAYNEQLAATKMAERQLMIQSAETMFGDLANITKGFVGESSAIYKSMFAISKAFAIADASVKIAQGVASAAAMPFPSNIPAMASVIAATASIISSIQSVQLEFGGGRRFGGGVRPGNEYRINEAGQEFFAPGQPGNIIPADAMGGGGQNVKVIINNYTNAEATVTESSDNGERKIEVMIKRVKNEIAAEIKEGRGSVNRSMASTFGLKRKGA